MSSILFPEVAAWFRQSFGSGTRSFLKNMSHRGRNKDLSHGVGSVSLVGAGPGDAELLTLKAYRLIQQADVILFDWLVGEDIHALFPATAERVFVGKKCGRHSMTQADICRLIVEYATLGKQVVRLKGGDPAIFARVAEECAVLEEAGIPFEIVPGITAASGASAYSGIPLTHRDCAQSVRFVTARLKTNEDEPNWRALVQAANGEQRETLVFYMGLRRLETIAARLFEYGLSPDTPVAVIEEATCARQKAVTGRLADIHQKVLEADITGPAITIVGEVVSHRFAVSSLSAKGIQISQEC